MSSYKGETFLTRSTFLPPARVNNLSDAEKLFEEWIHSQDSDDNRRYKSLMLPPKKYESNACRSTSAKPG